MKALWTIIAVMALANLLAILALAGWLKATGRLSRERIVLVQRAFMKTVADELQDKAAQAATQEKAAADAAAEAKNAEPPITAAEKIQQQQVRQERREQVLLRQQQELESLRSALIMQMANLEARERKLATEQTAFDTQRKRIIEMEGAQQFKVALTTLEGQKPKDAKTMLRALLDQQQKDQVVSYLAKMEEGKRVKVMAEFVKEEPALAADLLEQLRTRGVMMPLQKPSAQANERTASPQIAGDTQQP